MTGPASYRDACMRSDEAKEQMKQSAQAAKARISPARFKEDVKSKLTASATNGVALAAAKVQERPAAFGAAALAAVIFLARRPLSALFGRLYVGMTTPNPDILEDDDG